MNKIKKLSITFTGLLVLIVVVAVFTARAGHGRTGGIGAAGVAANVAPPAQEPSTIVAYDQTHVLSSSTNRIGPIDVSKFKQIRVVLIHLCCETTNYAVDPRILGPGGIFTFKLESMPIQPALESLGSTEGAMRVYTIVSDNIVFTVTGGSSGATVRIIVYGREN